MRARVDGEIVDLDPIPELDKKKKHTIEVVVDRFKVRDDLGNRIAESFETALRLGGDLAVLAWMSLLPQKTLTATATAKATASSKIKRSRFRIKNPLLWDSLCPTERGYSISARAGPYLLRDNGIMVMSAYSHTGF